MSVAIAEAKKTQKTTEIAEAPENGHSGIAWHRPLLWLAIFMAALTTVFSVAIFFDHQVITGVPALEKPLKFTISIGVYSLTLSWLIAQLKKWRRFIWWSGTVAAIGLVVEAFFIISAALSDTTSHFNVSTPYAAAVWSTMATAISFVWVAALPVMILLMRTKLGDSARTIAIRAGFVIALIGMALGFLMTIPTPDQISNYHGIVGAHTVGASDGGPGLPLLGWSTVAGDLRIPHFVGMHALQAIPLVLLGIELLSRWVPILRNVSVRKGLVWIVIALFSGILVVLTMQALMGQSIVQPSAPVIAASLALYVGAAIAAAIVLAVNRTKSSSASLATA